MEDEVVDEEDDGLLELCASKAAANPRGTSEDRLQVPHVDGRHFHTDVAAASAMLAEYAAHRRPVVFDGCVEHWPAISRWSHPYLRDTLGDSLVHVALTPNGLGDAVTPTAEDTEFFVKPHEMQMPFCAFVDAVESPLRDADGGMRACYSQPLHRASQCKSCQRAAAP